MPNLPASFSLTQHRLLYYTQCPLAAIRRSTYDYPDTLMPTPNPKGAYTPLIREVTFSIPLGVLPSPPPHSLYWKELYDTHLQSNMEGSDNVRNFSDPSSLGTGLEKAYSMKT